MTKLDEALVLGAMGFHVFPVKPNGKTPLHKGWQAEATRTPAAWDDAWNIGIFTGRFRDDEALLVVDVDVKNGKNGTHSLLALELAGLDLPDTLEAQTPSGGRHLFYVAPQAVRQGADTLGIGLDVRSRGGFVVAPGSTIGVSRYLFLNNRRVADAPLWLLERCGTPRRRSVSEDRKRNPRVDADRASERARRYLLDSAPVGHAGSLSDTSYRVACQLKDHGVEEAEAVELMMKHWAHAPAMDRDDMTTRVHNAYAYGLDPPGVAAPEANFDVVQNLDTEGQPSEDLSPYAVLNQEYAYVAVGNLIIWETTDEHGRPTLERMSVENLHNDHAPTKINLGGKDAALTKDWMQWKGRRSYKKIVFAPGQEVLPRFYNLWTGFAVEPEPGVPSAIAQAALDAFLDHALVNVCRNDQALCRWLLGYFAHLIQRPWEKPLVALVFRGAKGVGKNALIERIGFLLGCHFMVADDARYLLSNFNGHLESTLLIVLDEAAWAGDKKAESRLKGLITGSHHVIERKGQEPYKVDNRTRVAILGNEEWLVPASHDERRFAVFDVGEGRKQDRAYFQAMREGMEAGGYRLLLRYLQGFDLAGIEPNQAPITAALLEQKHETLNPFNQWWLACLEEGRVIGSDFGVEWPVKIERDKLRAAFGRYVRERQIRSRLPDEKGMGRQVKHWGFEGGRGSTGYAYKVPGLADARAIWDGFIGHAGEWGDS